MYENDSSVKHCLYKVCAQCRLQGSISSWLVYHMRRPVQTSVPTYRCPAGQRRRTRHFVQETLFCSGLRRLAYLKSADGSKVAVQADRAFLCPNESGLTALLQHVTSISTRNTKTIAVRFTVEDIAQSHIVSNVCLSRAYASPWVVTMLYNVKTVRTLPHIEVSERYTSWWDLIIN